MPQTFTRNMLFRSHIILCTVANGTVLVLAEPQLSVSVFDVHWTSCQSESGEMSEEAVSLSGVVKMRQRCRHLAIPSQTHLHWIHSLKGFPPTFHGESDKMLILQYTVCCVAAKIVFLLLAYSPIRPDTGRNVCIHTYIFEKATKDAGKLQTHRYTEGKGIHCGSVSLFWQPLRDHFSTCDIGGSWCPLKVDHVTLSLSLLEAVWRTKT